MSNQKTYEAIVMGTSAGGLSALKKMLPGFPADFPCPVLVVQHISPQSDSYLIKMLDELCPMKVKEAVDTEQIESGTIYFAPPDYHLLVETDRSMSLTVDEKVNYSRPSIDVLFETAAEAYGENLIGIILTGANADGAVGLLKIKNYGGYTMVQDPNDAENAVMPEKAMRMVLPDQVLTIDEMVPFLLKMNYHASEKESPDQVDQGKNSKKDNSDPG
ncbi:MAG: chemotaxis protein CheB [Bacteroidales bacterium]|nr:chemotaxis protein CheB [Bacteroidales bacterium]